jgi:glycosyltransferase involved in cell wall biosynthesis
MTARRLLLIAYAFPPVVNAQAIRWLMLVRELWARGYQIDVLSIRLPAYFVDLLDELPPGVRVHRTWPGPIEGVSRSARATVRSEDDWVATRLRPGSHGLARGLYRGVRRLADGLLIPDLCTEWLPFAVTRGLSILRATEFDALVSTSEPGVDHLAAFALKRRSGLPWLADFGDPWVNQNTPGWRESVDNAIGQRLIGGMDGVTVTVPQLAKWFEARFPRLQQVRVVRQGFDRELLSRINPVRRPPPATLSLVYTGTLYPGFRDPTPVFEALRETRRRGLDVRLTVAGRVHESMIDAAARAGIADAIDFVGIVPYKQSLALQKGADVLLHLDNAQTPLQMPGKLHEYLGANRPILVIRHGARETSAAALCVQRGGCGRDVTADPADIADTLREFQAERLSGGERLPHSGFAEAYTFARSADELCVAIDEAIDRAPAPRRGRPA